MEEYGTTQVPRTVQGISDITMLCSDRLQVTLSGHRLAFPQLYS